MLWLAYPINLASGAAWGLLMARYPAATFAPIALLVPVIGMAGGVLVYGERLGPGALLGSALVIAGLAVLMGAAQATARRPKLD